MKRVLSLATLAVAAISCSDPNTTKLQYTPDMADAPTQKTQRNYLDPPEGSIAMNSYPYPRTVEEAEKVLTMPQRIAMDPAQEAEGKTMYDTYCFVCHGADAKGNGPVVGKDGEQGLMAPPPDLTQAVYQQRGDGFFFYRITFGGSIMPSYGHAIMPAERWQIIKYLRTLQKAGGH